MRVAVLILLTLLNFIAIQSAHAVTPGGTVISSTAEITFTTAGSSNFKISTNTEEFIVIDFALFHKAETAISPFGQNLYAGTTHTTSIDITNTGLNELKDGSMVISAPIGMDIDLTGTDVTLTSKTKTATTQTLVYSLPDMVMSSLLQQQLALSIPLSVDPENNTLTIKHIANDRTITEQTVELNLQTRTEATLEILQYSHTDKAEPVIINTTEYDQGSGSFQPIPAPELPDEPGVLVTDGPITLEPTSKFSHQQTLFVRVIDPDQNMDNNNQESIVIDLAVADNSESEKIRLTETSTSSGIFTGYVNLKQDNESPNDGTLNVHPNTEVNVNYYDHVDSGDADATVVLIDPFGIVFDSATGQPLDNFTVSMINTDTGEPADVYGDDGVSSYQSTMLTGGTVIDAGGTVYAYSTGNYRFPLAPQGNYKLVVEVPSGAKYTWPSTRSAELLANLPINNMSIVLGSRGETFPLLPGPPLHIDIPVDPVTAQMYVQRSANKNSVAVGDYIKYTVSVENITDTFINNVTLIDNLPQGFRLQESSLRIDGNPAAAPDMGDDGTTLTFNLSQIESEQTINIEYLAVVGAAKPGVASSSSHASAYGGAAQSNTASHEIVISDELMYDRALLMGQLIVEGEKQTDIDLSGTRIYMEDGRYAITDQQGKYHFENIRPGVHVVQLDLTTLPEGFDAVLRENNSRFSDTAWSQFVDVQGGTMWRTDFYLVRKPVPTGSFAIQIENHDQHANGEIPYIINMEGKKVDISNIRLSVKIPAGTSYVPGSSRYGDAIIDDPRVLGGEMLIYRLGNNKGDWKKSLQYTVTMENTAGISELSTEAITVYNTPSADSERLPVAKHKLVLMKEQTENKQIIEELILRPRFASGSTALRTEDKEELRNFAEKVEDMTRIRIHVTGHSDNTPVTQNGRNTTYKDNYLLSEYRAFSVAKFLQKYLYLSPENITTDGKGPDEPIAENDTEEGRAANRRVHIIVYRTTQSTPLYSAPEKLVGSRVSAMTKGVLPGTEPIISASDEELEQKLVFDTNWLAKQNADIAWISPAIGEIPSISAVDIRIKHSTKQEVELVLNGEKVSYRNFESTLRGLNQQALSQWKGVDVKNGTNLFVAKVMDRSGNIIKTLEHTLRFSDEVTNAEIIAEESELVADGRTNPVVAIRLTDTEDYPIRPGYGVEFRVNAPFLIEQSGKFNTQNMVGAAATKQLATIGKNGIAKIILQPTTNTDDLIITFPRIVNNENLEVRTRLKATPREWVIVGLAEGTMGYNSIRGNIKKLEGDSAREHLYQDGRVALFAKGQVLGKWLMTIAYDSDKVRPQKEGNDPGLYQAIDPGSYYTIYGDSAQNGFDAASSEKLYLKLERDEFFFLYGDFGTGFSDTELAKYSRTLTGVKTRYQDEKYDITVFSSETNQAFVRDELRGKGVTGPYQLTRNKIALNSETITLESRNRFRSEEVSDSRTLQRHIDYDIDYRSGTLQFREPVFSVDQNLNHQYIIAEYESFDSADDKVTYGARAKVAVNEKLDIGITHVNEGRTGGEAKLGGIDAQYKLSSQTKINVETARTLDSKITTGTAQGNAYQAEVHHQTERTNNKVYLHNTEGAFGLGQTPGSESSMRKAGLETNIKASEKINIKGQAYRQKNTLTHDTRDTLEAQTDFTHNNTNLRLGLREVKDRTSTNGEQVSQQITSGISQRMMDGSLTVRADREQNLSEGNSVDFPNRTRLGADLKVADNTSLFIEQEITHGKVRDTRNTLTGLKSTPWNGSSLYTGITKSSTASGETTSANVSLAQNWKINDKWSVDLGAEESRLLSQKSGTPLNINTGFASGPDNDFLAVSAGATYTTEKLIWTSRVDTRNTTTQDDWGLATSVQTDPQNNLSMLASLQYSETNGTASVSSSSSIIGLGLAYRPVKSKWLIMDKLELMHGESTSAGNIHENWKVINMLHANYKVDRWQLSTQYSAKTVKETIDGIQYHNFVDLTGVETRYDLTAKWDVGAHANILHSWDLKQYQYNSGVSVGHSFAKNIWVSVGYNFAGFRDEDFSRGNHTSEGMFLKFRIKFDQRSMKEAADWLKK